MTMTSDPTTTASRHAGPFRLPSWLLAGIVLMAFLLRLILVEAMGFPQPFGDVGDYVDAATRIVAGQDYPIQGSAPLLRPPGLPMTLAAFQLMGGHLEAFGILQAAFGAIAAGATALIAARCFAPHALMAGAFAGLGMALWPMLVVMCTSVRAEPLSTALTAGGCLSVLVALEHRGGRATFWAAAGGVILAASALVRSPALSTTLLLAVVIGVGLRRYIVSLALVLGLTIGIAPWSQYTASTYGERLVVDNALGWAMWFGNRPEMLPLYQDALPDHLAMLTVAHKWLNVEPYKLVARWEATEHYSRLGPASRSRLFGREAAKQIRRDPRLFVTLLWTKLRAFWRPWVSPVAYSPGLAWLTAALNVPVWGLALAGLWQLARNRGTRWFAVFCVLLLLGQTATHVLTVVQSRYRIVTLDPWLLMLAAGGLAGLWSQWRQRARTLFT